MGLKIGTIEYTVGDETFEVEVDDISSVYHNEPGGYKEPDDTVETVIGKVKTEHGTITLEASARRSGLSSYFEYEDNPEISIDSDDKSIEILPPNCTIEDDNT